MNTEMAPPGLEGVIVGRSRLSRVDGKVGSLTIAGYAVEDLAPRASFESVVHLLWHDALPEDEHAWATHLAQRRDPGATALDVVVAAAKQGAPGMTAMRLGLAAVALEDPCEARIVAVMPSLFAAFDRARRGLDVLAPDPSLSHVADLLRMWSAQAPSAAKTRALETYLNTVVEHGLNASAFAARVVASTGASLGSAVEAGLCALEGPLHGGAPGPALEALLKLRSETGDLDANTRAWVRAEVAAGRRIMGFGHRVYRVRDPRSVVLRGAAQHLLEGDPILNDAHVHERAVLDTLAQLKPDRPISTNVEFATALLLHGLRLPADLFTPMFAIARTAGWIAHAREQRQQGRLIRPRLAYAGATGRIMTTTEAPTTTTR